MRLLAVATTALMLVLLASGCITVNTPTAAPAAADPTGAAVAAQAPAAAPGGGGLFGLKKSPEAKAQHWANFAKTPLGQMVNNLLKPLSALTGGMLGPVGANDPAKQKLPADSAGGAAAKIAAAEAQAKAKIADLEFLSTKDCRRYPEAEAAILNALRAEPNECVRWAAAKALLSGCCCTQKVIKTLTVVVNQSDKDGNLAEDSERVRLTAFLALERCMRTCQPAKAEEPPEKPGPKEKEKAESEVAQVKFEKMSESQVFAEARAALAKGVSVSPRAVERMSGPANLRDMVFGPPIPKSSSLPPAPEAVETPAVESLALPAANRNRTPEPKPVEPTPLPRDRSLTGLFKRAAGSK